MKKLIYLAVVALGLMATAGADAPWPPDCYPNCSSVN
jgi:hypothetical protein